MCEEQSHTSGHLSRRLLLIKRELLVRRQYMQRMKQACLSLGAWDDGSIEALLRLY
jgi:hypothetical protein